MSRPHHSQTPERSNPAGSSGAQIYRARSRLPSWQAGGEDVLRIPRSVGPTEFVGQPTSTFHGSPTHRLFSRESLDDLAVIPSISRMTVGSGTQTSNVETAIPPEVAQIDFNAPVDEWRRRGSVWSQDRDRMPHNWVPNYTLVTPSRLPEIPTANLQPQQQAMIEWAHRLAKVSTDLIQLWENLKKWIQTHEENTQLGAQLERNVNEHAAQMQRTAQEIGWYLPQFQALQQRAPPPAQVPVVTMPPPMVHYPQHMQHYYPTGPQVPHAHSGYHHQPHHHMPPPGVYNPQEVYFPGQGTYYFHQPGQHYGYQPQ